MNEKCGICEGPIVGFGNNGLPLTPKRVCDPCNMQVLNTRLLRILAEQNK